MEIGQFFSGNALSAVDGKGRVALPAFVRSAVERRCGSRALLMGAHESDPCLTGYDLGYVPRLHAEIERRRLRDEAAGASADAHHDRARRAFGLAEDAAYDEMGRVVLPPMLRRRGRIETLALFVGTGAGFEIWNPHLARESGGETLRELADFRLAQGTIGEREERI